MKRFAAVAMACMFLTCMVPIAQAAPCLVVTLTGSQGGPGVFNGLAGPGTLVQYGDDSNDCNAVLLQFEAGRGTNMRLSQIGVDAGQLHAIFFTHMHSDHTEGFIDIMQLRWHNVGTKLDVVCSADAVSPLGHTLSCKKLAAHIGDTLIQSGEIAQRVGEDKTRLPGGPAELANVITFEPKDQPQAVWTSGDVKVSAIRSTHMPGHTSYRVDTPAGSVVYRRRRRQRCHRAAAFSLDLRSGGDVGKRRGHHRARGHPPDHGPRQRQRLSGTSILSPEHRERSRRHGQESGCQAPHAHASDPTDRLASAGAIRDSR